MTRAAKNYEFTSFYQVYCKDSNVSERFFGFTTNFHVRKVDVKKQMQNLNFPQFNVIRANGGFENWEIERIEVIACADVGDAKKRKNYHSDAYRNKLKEHNESILPDRLARLQTAEPIVEEPVLVRSEPAAFIRNELIDFENRANYEAFREKMRAEKKREKAAKPSLEETINNIVLDFTKKIQDIITESKK